VSSFQDTVNGLSCFTSHERVGAMLLQLVRFAGLGLFGSFDAQYPQRAHNRLEALAIKSYLSKMV